MNEEILPTADEVVATEETPAEPTPEEVAAVEAEAPSEEVAE